MIIWIQHSYAYFHTCGDRRPDYALPAFIPASPIQVAILYQWGKCFRPLIRTIENRTQHQIVSYSSTRVDKRLLICFTGNKSHAAVVVRQHHDGTPHQIGPEEPFAGGVEVVAVAEPVHGCLFEGFDNVADDAPDLEVVGGIHANRLVFRVRGHQPGATLLEPHALDRELPVDVADGDAAVIRGHRTIDDEQVAIADAVPGHAVARDAHEEGRGGVVDKLPIQIQRSIEKVVGRRRKAGLHLAARHGDLLPGGEIRRMKSEFFDLVVHLVVGACRFAPRKYAKFPCEDRAASFFFTRRPTDNRITASMEVSGQDSWFCNEACKPLTIGVLPAPKVVSGKSADLEDSF